MLKRLWRKLTRKGSPFSYIAHEYLRDTWRCLSCDLVVHTNALDSHARTAHAYDDSKIQIHKIPGRF